MTTNETPYVVDKADWVRGPWDTEPDKLQWRTEAGLPGLIVRGGGGALCGYAAVTDTHPWYGRDYSECTAHGFGCTAAWDDQHTPESVIDVHGGLTYAAACGDRICHVPEPGEPDNVWWFGFDTAHADDFRPQDAKYARQMQESYHVLSSRTDEGVPVHITSTITGRRFAHTDYYRDVAYVRAEVERLASQLVEAARRGSH